MTEPKDKPARPKPAPDDRKARLAAALRDNLRRRKVGVRPSPRSDEGET